MGNPSQDGLFNHFYKCHEYDKVHIYPLIWRSHEEKINITVKTSYFGSNFELGWFLYTRGVFQYITLDTFINNIMCYMIFFSKKRPFFIIFYVTKNESFDFNLNFGLKTEQKLHHKCFFPYGLYFKNTIKTLNA